MTLLERVNNKIIQGYTDEIANGLVGQEIILEAISKSPMIDRILLKGGIVMYNITSNARRATRDLDLDLIRYDIQNNKNIDMFIKTLDKCAVDCHIKRIGEISELHQEDYRGKRAYVKISDKSYSFTIKLDIGVHTLFAIEQQNMEFKVASDKNKVTLLTNPIEQVVGEKLYSLAKHGVLSTRYKDIFDVYYLITNKKVDNRILKKCLLLLIEYGKSNINDMTDLCNRIDETLNNSSWYQRFETSNQNWIDEDDKKKIVNTILDFIYSV